MTEEAKCGFYLTANGAVLTGEAADIYAKGTAREREILMIGYAHGVEAARLDKEVGERMEAERAARKAYEECK